jgi:hypothetical protein
MQAHDSVQHAGVLGEHRSSVRTMLEGNQMRMSMNGGSGGEVLQDAMSASDHRVAPGAVVGDLKICEGCGTRRFFRPRGSDDRYCKGCHASPTFFAVEFAIVH